jgi:hypothetical protein
MIETKSNMFENVYLPLKGFLNSTKDSTVFDVIDLSILTFRCRLRSPPLSALGAGRWHGCWAR